MFKWLKNLFQAPKPPKFTLEQYLSDKSIETSQQLDYWIAEFHQRERDIHRYLAQGNSSMADWIRLQY